MGFITCNLVLVFIFCRLYRSDMNYITEKVQKSPVQKQYWRTDIKLILVRYHFSIGNAISDFYKNPVSFQHQ